MLRTSDLDYELPEGRIATAPAEPRDSARLMVVRRDQRGASAVHAQVRDLPRFLRRGDLLVVNTSRVIPARVLGERADTGGRVEGLYLGPAGEGGVAECHAGEPEASRGVSSATGTPPAWRMLLRGRRLRPGVCVSLRTSDGLTSGVVLRLVRKVEAQEGVPVNAHRGPSPADLHEDGAWITEAVDGTGTPLAEPAVTLLERCGLPPLPPYIRAARKRRHEAETVPADTGSYQTVYAADHHGARGLACGEVARVGVPDGSVAAPTAGLHFTPDLLARLDEAGVERAGVVLHVGAGTFKPVEAEFVEQHPIHAEWCEVPAATASRLAAARREGRRVIAVGTTSARTLESFTPEALSAGGAARWTRLLITPGHRWRAVDGLMTNFHLPRSSLMALVAAHLQVEGAAEGDGVARLRALYTEAVREGYRFYSYGDGMLLLPD